MTTPSHYLNHMTSLRSDALIEIIIPVRYIWYNQGVGDIDWFCAVFKMRLSCDMFQQEWHGRICDSTRATFFRTFKDQITFSPYLDVV